MSTTRAGKFIGVDHATIIHGNKITKEQLELGNPDFSISIINWRDILDDLNIVVEDDHNTVERTKKRILNVLEEAVSYGVISKEEKTDLLKDVLKTLVPND